MSAFLEQLTQSDDIHIDPSFFTDAELAEILSHIQSQPFIRDREALYPGETLALSQTLEQQLKQKFSRVLGMNFKNSHSRIRRMIASDDHTDQTKIHVDANCLVAICYLSQNIEDEIGTSFFFHNYRKNKKMTSRENIKEFIADDIVLRTAHKNYSDWTCWKSVEARFNTAIVFDGHLYHSGPQALSDRFTCSKERITLDYFIRRDQF